MSMQWMERRERKSTLLRCHELAEWQRSAVPRGNRSFYKTIHEYRGHAGHQHKSADEQVDRFRGE